MSEKNFNFIGVHEKSPTYTKESWQNLRYIQVDQIFHMEYLLDLDHLTDKTFGTRIIYNWSNVPEILDVFETMDEVIQLIRQID